MNDRRTVKRYDLSLPVIVRARVDKEPVSRTGETQNISNRGVYFTIDSNLSVEAELDITMILPADVTADTEVFIRAAGKVIRVDKRSENVGEKVNVAVMFEIYEIVRNEPTA